ncbi:MAG: hypothetical protein K0R68_3629, partial [Mycobacterium sp.]|nr:hypothetical protein [Mycobacterium sp.]
APVSTPVSFDLEDAEQGTDTDPSNSAEGRS